MRGGSHRLAGVPGRGRLTPPGGGAGPWAAHTARRVLSDDGTDLPDRHATAQHDRALPQQRCLDAGELEHPVEHDEQGALASVGYSEIDLKRLFAFDEKVVSRKLDEQGRARLRVQQHPLVRWPIQKNFPAGLLAD